MIVLGIETATELVGVCVVDAGGSRAGAWAAGRRRHAETLAPGIRHVLDQAGVALAELTAVAVDVGPGLFTGLRVGVATAKGLAQGLGIGVVGVGSLAALARAAFDAGHVGTIVSVVDARRGEVFAQSYRAGPEDATVRPLEPPRVLAPDALALDLSVLTGRGSPVVAVGDGAVRYAEVLRAGGGTAVAGPLLASPPPETVVTLAVEHLAAGGAALSPARVVPDYLRGPDAKINWQQRDGGGTPRADRARGGGDR